MAKTTTITIDNGLLKRIVRAAFYGGCYTSAYHMSDCSSVHKAFDALVEILQEQGWTYTMNGQINQPKR